MSWTGKVLSHTKLCNEIRNTMENLRNKSHKEGGRQKEEKEDFRLQNDEFDPYAIVVLNQL